jgi:general nucleoside transport system permease protein
MSVLSGALQGSVTMAAPLLLASLGELVVQRSGVVNVGLEGLILTGSLAAVLGTMTTHNPILGVACAAIAAMVIALIFALFAVRLAANQVVVGVVINLLALGLTGTVNRAVFGKQGTFVSVEALPHVIGGQTILTFLALLMAPTIWWLLNRTRHGLTIRAAGEQPIAAESSGISVLNLRTCAVAFGGIMAGIAGACLSVGDVPTFQEGMSAGRGFIALAIVTAGRWTAPGCAAAALVFGLSEELDIQGQAMGLHIPHDILLAIPYVITLIILLSGSHNSKAPASLGTPYIKR